MYILHLVQYNIFRDVVFQSWYMYKEESVIWSILSPQVPCAVFENVYCYSTKSCVTDLFSFLDPVAHGTEVRGAGSQVLSDTVPRVHKSDLLY